KLGVGFNLLKEVLDINEAQKRYFVQKIQNALWNLKAKTIGALGLSFKGNTDDMRYSPAVDIIRYLQKEGAHIQAYDPQAMTKAKTLLQDVRFVRSPYDAAKHADAIALLTDWGEFASLDFIRIKKVLKHPVIFDGRNMLNPVEMKKLGFQYHGIGRGK
ncbi:MAG: UDP-glucose 6-dehydrogenase, partial [Candidatus Omnitrophica bacterium]|nr:UDP-glucose 6-dehydrogenase [Candidatus Omnitrophota bacterium]